MKRLFLALLILLPIGAFSMITAEQEFALNRLSGTAQKYSLGTALAKTPNVVIGKYSFAVQGGAVGSVFLLRDLNDSTSRVTIPDNAVIKQVYTDTLTSLTNSSVSIGAVSTTDLVANSQATYFTGVQAGTPINTAATMIKLSADKDVKLSISNVALTAGKINVYIEYVLGD